MTRAFAALRGWIVRALAVLAVAGAGTSAAASITGPAASFDFVAYRALDPAPPAPAGSYRNPILPGFQPDPSIVKVGRDFYLVTSTFSWFPGLPIYHSTDLMNWRLVGHAIDRADQLRFDGIGTNRGLFAPAIEHHGGKFWIVNTCIECGGNFVITADRAEGPWSDPVFLDFGGIDPSLHFTRDGRVFIVYNDAPPGEPHYDGHRAIWLREFDPVAMTMKPGRTLLVNGGLDLAQEPVWAEGPHIYQVGDWFYLSTAEGGTAERHSQTIYRAKRIEGPYEAGPVNPILTQRDLDPARADRVEATGHADLVRLDDGSWWGVFLATRPFAAQSTLLGRETWLLPLRWKDGWPRFLDPGEAVPMVAPAPALPPSPGTGWDRWRDDFTGPLSGEWIGLRSPGARQQVALDRAAGALVLMPDGDGAGGLGKSAFLGRRLRHHAAEFTTRVTFTPRGEGDFAGLLAFMDEAHFVTLGIEGGDVVLRRRAQAGEAERGVELARIARPGTAPLELRLQLRGGSARAEARAAGSARWVPVGATFDVEPLASVHAGLFTGLVVGPYAVSGIATGS